jgi:hypothetical protein
MARSVNRTGDGHPRLFAFERDLFPSLHCIPMLVRYKLDLIGLKVPLKAWNRLPLTQRLDLLDHGSVATDAGRRELRARLGAWLGAVSDEPLRPVILEESPPWQEARCLCPEVAEQAARCRPPLTVEEWASLGLLERFALVKLARSKHERGRIAQAVAEFRRWRGAEESAGGSRSGGLRSGKASEGVGSSRLPGE